MSNLRLFAVAEEHINHGDFFGRIAGRDPDQAAIKAFWLILKQMKELDIPYNGPILFKIKEITKNSNNDVFNFEGWKEILNKPVENPMNPLTKWTAQNMVRQLN